MSAFKTFEEIRAWQIGHKLVLRIYGISNQTPFAKDFALRDQIRRASVSIVSNIAEGYDRNGNREFLQFLSMAKGSAAEVRTHLYIARDLGYIEDGLFKELLACVSEVGRLLGALMSYLKNTGFKGPKSK